MRKSCNCSNSKHCATHERLVSVSVSISYEGFGLATSPRLELLMPRSRLGLDEGLVHIRDQHSIRVPTISVAAGFGFAL